mmetsp:Transcript_101360/g.151866  ORF Transcript_101360/g.151866 Transcript_101360/m.151866 type:complete len:304 (-) Transcript_101360:1506-2417(-)
MRVLCGHEVARRRKKRGLEDAGAGLGVVVPDVVDALAVRHHRRRLRRLPRRLLHNLQQLLRRRDPEPHVLHREVHCLLELRRALVDDLHQQRLALRLGHVQQRRRQVARVDVPQRLLAPLQQHVRAVLGRHPRHRQRLLLLDGNVLVGAPLLEQRLDGVLDLVDERLDLARLLHHVGLLLRPDARVLDQHAQPKARREQQVARQRRELRVEQPLDLVLAHARKHDVPAQIEPAAPGAPRHLAEVHGVEEDGVAGEDRGLGRHVDAHRQRLGRDHHREPLHAEQALDGHAVLAGHAGVVRADAA